MAKGAQYQLAFCWSHVRRPRGHVTVGAAIEGATRILLAHPGVGPEFAWKAVAQRTFESGGEKVTVLEMRVGSDAAAGATSAYEGSSYLVVGEGWIAERWVDVQADGPLSEFLAETGHNLIVDGIMGRNGFRGLARGARGGDPARARAVLARLPEVGATEGLTAFLRDPNAIPGLSDAMRRTILTEMAPATMDQVGSFGPALGHERALGLVAKPAAGSSRTPADAVDLLTLRTQAARR